MDDILAVTKKLSDVLEEQLWFSKLISTFSNEEDKIKFTRALKNRALGIYMGIKDEQEKEIFEQLLNDIDVLILSDYHRLINKCYKKLRNNYPSTKKFYIIPLLKKSAVNNKKVKSGMLVSYLFNSYQFSLIDDSENYHPSKIIIKSYLDENDLNRISEAEDSLIVFVDDFVGSGNSAIKVYDSYFVSKYNDLREKTCLLTLTILDIGLSVLEKSGIPIVFGSKYLSLSSKYKNNPEKLKEIKQTIQKMSEESKVDEEYIFGYNKCLSTIVTIHAPNNNVPFLWCSKINKGKPLFLR